MSFDFSSDTEVSPEADKCGWYYRCSVEINPKLTDLQMCSSTFESSILYTFIYHMTQKKRTSKNISKSGAERILNKVLALVCLIATMFAYYYQKIWFS